MLAKRFQKVNKTKLFLTFKYYSWSDKFWRCI